MLAITWKRDGVTHVKARLWGRSVKMCPSGDVIFIRGACWNAVRDTVRSTSRLGWTQTGAGTSRAPCFWRSALLRVPYRGGALFFVVRFEWFSSSPLMTTHQARGWEHRAREGKSNKENRTTEWNQVTFFFHSCTLKVVEIEAPESESQITCFCVASQDENIHFNTLSRRCIFIVTLRWRRKG